MKRVWIMALVLCLLTGCAVLPSQTAYNPYDKPYTETYRPERQASTGIAVKDGKVYCAYLADVDGKEAYAIDVFEKNEWQREETATTSIYDHPLFCERLSYDPLNETVGRYTLYTDEEYRMFICEKDSRIRYELPGGGEGIRRVATDHQNTITVLTSETTMVDGISMAKIYVITLEWIYALCNGRTTT